MVKINYKEICVVAPCPFCGGATKVEVNEKDYWDWQDGELVQVAFPYLSADEREALISGICSTCWDKMFGSFDEEEEEEDFEEGDNKNDND